MNRRLRVAILVVCAALAVALSQPSPARAIDGGEIAIWSGVAAGAAIVIVLIATYFTRDEDSFFLVDPPRDPQEPAGSGVHFGPQCVNPDGTAAILCW
jgi:hypothetical protein